MSGVDVEALAAASYRRHVRPEPEEPERLEAIVCAHCREPRGGGRDRGPRTDGVRGRLKRCAR
jgi:hypothetical protein